MGNIANHNTLKGETIIQDTMNNEREKKRTGRRERERERRLFYRLFLERLHGVFLITGNPYTIY